MVVAVALAITIGSLFMLQAIHVWTTRDTQFFFLTKAATRPVPRMLVVSSTLIYGLPALAIFALLVSAAVRSGKGAILAWISGDLIGGVILFAIGLSAVVYPQWVVNGLRDAYPNVDRTLLESRVAWAITRIVGTIVLAGGVLVLSLVKRHG